MKSWGPRHVTLVPGLANDANVVGFVDVCGLHPSSNGLQPSCECFLIHKVKQIPLQRRQGSEKHWTLIPEGSQRMCPEALDHNREHI